jgi:hypothetical protein
MRLILFEGIYVKSSLYQSEVLSLHSTFDAAN